MFGKIFIIQRTTSAFQTNYGKFKKWMKSSQTIPYSEATDDLLLITNPIFYFHTLLAILVLYWRQCLHWNGSASPSLRLYRHYQLPNVQGLWSIFKENLHILVLQVSFILHSNWWKSRSLSNDIWRLKAILMLGSAKNKR